MTEKKKTILVIGGGISGITAALEAAEVGYEVILVEKESYLGGRVVRMNRYFPKMCPPTCGFEINMKRIKNNPRITVYTLSEVTRISGEAGNFDVVIQQQPRFVQPHAQIPKAVIDKLSSERDDSFNLGMSKSKSLYYPHGMAYPPQFVLDKKSLSAQDEELLKNECPEGSIDFNETPREITVNVGAVIVTTGWQPYDATRIENLGFGRCENVITNVMMERLASQEGPTQGKLLRPSDGKEVQKVAFAQCAGSRDENHLPYCSAVCCMGSLKQARYVLEKNPDAQVTIFYIDIRTIGRFEKFYYDLLEEERVHFVKGKVALIQEDPATKNPQVELEDSISGRKIKDSFDLVVLATGMEATTAKQKIPCDGIAYDAYGFIDTDKSIPGIFAAGCDLRPVDVARSVRQATGAALKAIQCVRE